MGRSWVIEGKVVKGEQRGRKIGYPTCNIKFNNYDFAKLGVILLLSSLIKKKRIANIGIDQHLMEETLLRSKYIWIKSKLI